MKNEKIEATAIELIAKIKKEGRPPETIFINPKYRAQYNVLLDIKGLDSLAKIPVEENQAVPEDNVFVSWDTPIFKFS